jgi:hypothetical protein
MALVSGTLPTLGGPRGDGEAAVRNLLSAILTEVNGDLEVANLKGGGLDAVKLRGITEVLGSSPAVAYIGDIDGAKWLVGFASFRFVFYSDSADTGAIAGIPNLTYAGRTYRAKVALGPDGTIATASVRKSIIAAAESRSTTSYGTLTTPDKVTVTLPTDGLLKIMYQATWDPGGGLAAIFIGANQLKYLPDNSGSGAPIVQEAGGGSVPGAILSTRPDAGGLLAIYPSVAYTGEVTTGQTFGVVTTVPISGRISGSGPIYVFAAAGTYDVSVQFKAGGSAMTVSKRKLWVSVEPYS